MDSTKFKIEKSTVECYKVTHASGDYWATITVDVVGPGRGRIQIASDFGHWTHGWGAAGKDFKEFLTRLNIDYAAGKFGADRWFDHEATIKGFRDYVTRNAADLEDIYTLLTQITELEKTTRKDEFFVELRRRNELMRAFDYMPEICYSIHPGFRRFWAGPWQKFVQALIAENVLQQSKEENDRS